MGLVGGCFWPLLSSPSVRLRIRSKMELDFAPESFLCSLFKKLFHITEVAFPQMAYSYRHSITFVMRPRRAIEIYCLANNLLYPFFALGSIFRRLAAMFQATHCRQH